MDITCGFGHAVEIEIIDVPQAGAVLEGFQIPRRRILGYGTISPCGEGGVGVGATVE